MWPANIIFNAIFLAFSMHIINLDYLEDKILYITELSDGNTEELDLRLRLEHTIIISDNDD